MKTQNLILLPTISILSFSNPSSAFLLKKIVSQKLQNPAQLSSRALTDVIREFYIANNIEFDFIIYGEKTQHIIDVIDLTVKEISSEIKINIRHIKNTKKWNHARNQSAVFLTKSEQNLFKLNNVSMYRRVEGVSRLARIQHKRFKFVVYTEEMINLNQLSNCLRNISRSVVHVVSDLRFFEFFIINGHKSVDLAANVLYSETSCGDFTQKLLNSFDKITQKWETKLKNFEPFYNLNGCMLTMRPWLGFNEFYSFPEYNDLIDSETVIERITRPEGYSTLYVYLKQIKYRGLVNELMTTLADRNNFTLNFNAYGEMPGTQVVVLNENFKQPFDSMITIDWGDRDKMFHNDPKQMTNSIGETEIYYLVTENDLYTNYEKMMFAFDTTTWILILMIYGLTFLAIAVLQVTSRKIKKIVFGEGVNIPAYNALGIFFGIGQIKLPKKYFGRFILILYIWFCLMIRTCYQSKMFEFITSDMRKPLPKTIEDLVYWNYTILLDAIALTEYNNRIINGRERPKNLTVDLSLFKLMYEDAVKAKSTTKYAFLIIPDVHAWFNASFKTSLKVLSDEKFTITNAMMLVENNFLFDQLCYFLDQYLSAGIPKYLSNYAQWLLRRPIDVEAEDPRRILTLEMLEFGFVLWFCACCFSTFVFICECRLLWIKRKLRKLIGLIDFLRVLWHRLQDYHDRW